MHTFKAMKALHSTPLLVTALMTCLTSCQMEQPEPVPPVPEMPYRPRAVANKPAEEVQTTSWESAPDPAPYISNTEAGAMANRPSTPPPPIPDPVPAPPKPEPKDEAPSIKPLDMSAFSTPAAPAAPAAASTTPAAPKPTAQTEQLPIATRVEGDPTHVWNPLAPSKTIRIVDPNTGQPFPSGKKLKVRGRDGKVFYFIVQ